MNPEFVLQIILRARDEVSRVAEEATQRIDRALNDLNKTFDRHSATTRSSASDLNKYSDAVRDAGGHLEDLKRNVDDARSSEDRFSRTTRTASSDTDRFDQTIRRLNQSILGLNRAIRGLALGGLSGDVDRTEASMRRLGKTSRDNEFHLTRLAAQLRGLRIVFATLFAQPLISALVALAGAFAAVASSAVAAASAVGATFVAAVNQAIPAAGLLVAVLARMTAIIKTVSLAEKEQEQAAFGAAQQQEAQARAAETLMDAQERLGDSLRNQREAVRALGEAREEAKRQIQDLILAEREAALAAEGASLSQVEAQQRLQQAISTGAGGLEVIRAQLGVDQAGLGVREAGLQSRRAREAADQARQGGVAGMDVTINAQRRLAEATRDTARAERDLGNAREALANTTSDLSATQRNLATELAKLSGAERAAFRAIIRFREEYRRQVRPITDIVVDAITDVVNRLTTLLSNPIFRTGLTALAQGMATSIRAFTSIITSPEAIRIFGQLMQQAAQNMPLIARAMGNFVVAFSRFSVAAGPFLTEFLNWVIQISERFDRWTRNTDEVSSFLATGRTHFQAWKDLAAAFIDLVAALGGAGLGAGLTVVERLTGQFREWAMWIRENREQVRLFFDQSIEAVSAIGRLLGQVAVAAVKVFDPESVQHFADFLGNVVVPVLSDAFRLFGRFVQEVEKFIALPFVGDLVRIVAEIFAFANILRFLLGILGLTAVAMRTVFGNPLVLALTGAVLAVDYLGKRFEFFKDHSIAGIGLVATAIYGLIPVFGALYTFAAGGAVTTSAVIRTALIRSGVGLLIVILGELLVRWKDVLAQIKLEMITFAISVLEPFTHIPEIVGGLLGDLRDWSQGLKNTLTEARLDAIHETSVAALGVQDEWTAGFAGMTDIAAQSGLSAGEAFAANFSSSVAKPEVQGAVASLISGATGPTVPTPGGTLTATQVAQGAAGSQVVPSGGRIIPGEHPTSGLEQQFPSSIDIAGKPGTLVRSPESGLVYKISGGPGQRGAGVGGWNVYIQGVSGRKYFFTHLGTVAVKQFSKVTGGQAIATIGGLAESGGTTPHVHVGVSGSGDVVAAPPPLPNLPPPSTTPGTAPSPIPRGVDAPRTELPVGIQLATARASERNIAAQRRALQREINFWRKEVQKARRAEEPEREIAALQELEGARGRRQALAPQPKPPKPPEEKEVGGVPKALVNLFAKLDNNFTRIGAAIERFRTSSELGLAIRLLGQRDPVLAARARGEELAGQVPGLVGQRSFIEEALANLRTRLKGAAGDEQRNALRSEIEKWETQLLEINKAILDNITGQMNAAQEAAQAALDQALERADRDAQSKLRLLGLQEGLSRLLGGPGAAAALGFARDRLAVMRENARAIANALGGAVPPELRALFPALGLQAGGRVPGGKGTPVLVGEAGYEEYIITTDPRHRSRSLSLISDLLANIGMGAQAGTVLGALIGAVPGNERVWRRMSQAQRLIAWENMSGRPWTGPVAAPGPAAAPAGIPSAPTAVPPPVVQTDPGVDRLAELLNSILGTLETIKELEERGFQEQIDAVSKTADQGLRMNDILTRISEFTGDTAGVEKLRKSREDILQTQLRGFRDLLAKGPVTGDQAFELQLGIKQLELALLELTDVTSKTQSFTSRAWEWFRIAIFTGAGALLPRFQIPALQGGGEIIRSGLAYVHAGETVVPTGQNAGAQVNLTINEVKEKADPVYLSRRLAFELSGRGL